jgi:hypothetical protein
MKYKYLKEERRNKMAKDICPSCEKRYEDGPDGLCSVCRGGSYGKTSDFCPGPGDFQILCEECGKPIPVDPENKFQPRVFGSNEKGSWPKEVCKECYKKLR